MKEYAWQRTLERGRSMADICETTFPERLQTRGEPFLRTLMARADGSPSIVIPGMEEALQTLDTIGEAWFNYRAALY